MRQGLFAATPIHSICQCTYPAAYPKRKLRYVKRIRSLPVGRYIHQLIVRLNGQGRTTVLGKLHGIGRGCEIRRAHF